MKDPKKPVLTSVLRTVAMASPHESLRLNQRRGLLAAGFSYPTTQPGVIDVYDVKADPSLSAWGEAPRSCCRARRSASSATRAASRPTA